MENFEVFYNNEQVGSVNVSNEGLFTVLKCRCTYFAKMLRLYSVGENGYYPIGILIPANGQLVLTKRYTKNDLRSIPISAANHFELYSIDEKPGRVLPPETPEQVAETKAAVEPEPEQNEVIELEPEPESEAESASESKPEEEQTSIWKLTDDPASLFADPELMEAASVIKGGMVAKDGNSLLLAIPITGESPFPMMPVFRYGSSAMIEGKYCIVFRIENGYLI